MLSTTSPNGGADWSNDSYSQSTILVYYPYGTNPAAHWRGARSKGQRAIGQYQTGGILAYDASTGLVREVREGLRTRVEEPHRRLSCSPSSSAFRSPRPR